MLTEFLRARLARRSIAALAFFICCATAAPARATVVNADFDGDGVTDHLVVADAPAGSLARLNASARLRVWLRHGGQRVARLNRRPAFGFGMPARASGTRLPAHRTVRGPARPQRLRRRHSGPEGARHISADHHARRTTPATQATSSDTAGLSTTPRGEIATTAHASIASSSQRLPASNRAGRRASRAPPSSSPL